MQISMESYSIGMQSWHSTGNHFKFNHEVVSLLHSDTLKCLSVTHAYDLIKNSGFCNSSVAPFKRAVKTTLSSRLSMLILRPVY